MIDNFNTPFATPNNGFATPQTGFASPVQPSYVPSQPTPAPAPVDRPDGFIEGWDEFEDYDFSQNAVQIKVFGVGGAGNNAVNRMFLENEKNAEMVVVNTDLPVLRSSPVRKKIAIGRETTRGHGAGSKPEIGKKAAEESVEVLKRMLNGTDMLYITAGMGGGTGTGASPVIASIARDMGILTVAIVTKPFDFEGPVRMAQAEDGINKLRECCDAVIIIPNQKLLTLSDTHITTRDAFKAADEVLIKSVQSICRLINEKSDINLDFADITTTLRNAGDAHIGVGIASGENKAMLAAEQAINSPLLETSIKDADGVLISVVTSPDTDLKEITDASDMIKKEASPNVNVIFGLKYEEQIDDKIEITVIATRNGGLRETPVIPSFANVQAEPEIKPAPAPAAPVAAPAVPNTPVAPSAPVHTPAPEPISVKPEPQPQPGSPFYGNEEFRFLQNIAMKKNPNSDR